MKRFVLATLACTFLNAHAAESFGGIRFHSSVPADQVTALKADVRYLFNTPVATQDAEFLSVAGLSAGDGPSLHNWVVNRVRHIVGETFELTEQNLIANDKYVFPKTPMPEMGLMVGIPKAAVVEMAPPVGPQLTTVMTNIGSGYYIMGKAGLEIEGKHTQLLVGVNLDGEAVLATSTRVGLLQVGAGLFDDKFSVSKNPSSDANSVNRLSTLFHEARHSDGNGKGTGFMHAACPKTHAYGAGPGQRPNYACEKVANGPYTIGGLSTRAMLRNCTTCTTEEMTGLAVSALDSFSRVLSGANARRRLTDYEGALKIYEGLVVTNTGLLAAATTDADKKKIGDELRRQRLIIEEMKRHIAELRLELVIVPVKMDAAPEGYWVPVSLEASKKTVVPSIVP